MFVFGSFLVFSVIPILLLVLWIVSEFHGGRALRIGLGTVMFFSFFIPFEINHTLTINGTQVACWDASRRYLDAITKELSTSDCESARKRISSSIETFNGSFHGHYFHEGGFAKTVDEAIAKLNESNRKEGEPPE